MPWVPKNAGECRGGTMRRLYSAEELFRAHDHGSVELLVEYTVTIERDCQPRTRVRERAHWEGHLIIVCPTSPWPVKTPTPSQIFRNS